MAIQPTSSFFDSSTSNDILFEWRSHLSPVELCKSGEVCQDWHNRSIDNRLWEQLYAKIEPNQPEQPEQPVGYKQIVINCLKKHRSRANYFFERMSNETATMICPSLSFDTLKKFSLLERSYSIISELNSRKDFTPFLIHVSQCYKLGREELLKDSPAHTDFLRLVDQFETENKLMSLFQAIMADLPDCYDRKTVSSISFELFDRCQEDHNTYNIFCLTIAALIKSHYDFTDFSKEKFTTPIKTAYGLADTVEDFALLSLIPAIKDSLKITEEDLHSCKLKRT